MKVNEVRIGNWVRFRDESDAQVANTGYDFSTVNSLTLLYGSSNIKEYNGITLTEEWVLRFGFDKKKWVSELPNSIECFYFEKNGIVVYLLKYCFEVEIITKGGQFNTFKSWNYVHQLQNLYFALTGEELELQPS